MAKCPLQVVEGETRAPFLRGVLTHSLLKRGLSFKEAYGIANRVRDHFQKAGRVSRKQLRQTVDSILEEKYGSTLPVRPQVLPDVIFVKGEEKVPFSKGILSRSLSAAGLDPSVAYSTALQIQEKLLSEKRKTISRRKLRRIVYSQLLEVHGQEAGERYLVWRHARFSNKPVVLLFGGSSGAGKTSLGSEVAHLLGIERVVTTDSVREIMRMMFSRDLLPTLHYSSYEAWKGWTGETSSEAVIGAFVEQSNRVNVGVTALVDRAAKENHNLVIEGVHLVPGLLNYERLQTRAYCVHVIVANLDPDAYARRFPLRAARQESRSPEKYLENIDAILQIQDYILEMAHGHDIPIVENEDLERSVSVLIETITDNLRAQLDLEGEKLVEQALSGMSAPKTHARPAPDS